MSNYMYICTKTFTPHPLPLDPPSGVHNRGVYVPAIPVVQYKSKQQQQKNRRKIAHMRGHYQVYVIKSIISLWATPSWEGRGVIRNAGAFHFSSDNALDDFRFLISLLVYDPIPRLIIGRWLIVTTTSSYAAQEDKIN